MEQEVISFRKCKRKLDGRSRNESIIYYNSVKIDNYYLLIHISSLCST